MDFDVGMQIPECVTREDVMFFDTDCAGVVNNIAYLRMIETCRTHLGAKMGMDFVSMQTSRLFPAVVRTEIDYRIPAKLGDKLIIHGKLDQVDRVRFWCSFVIKREGDDHVLVTCRQSLAMVQIDPGQPARPSRLPQEWHELWGEVLNAYNREG